MSFVAGRAPSRAAALLALALVAGTLPALAAPSAWVPIVAMSSSDADASAAVEAAGGTVEYRVPIARSVVARVPADRVAELRSRVRVHPNVPMRLQGQSYSGQTLETAYPAAVGATHAWGEKVTGKGIGVALVDTGVAQTPDLARRVVASADLTPEQNFSDTYGHGTFMAGLIAGDGTASRGRYVGIAPQAHLLSVKVAGADGSTSLGKVLYALQLVHHSRVRFNTRVLLLALSSEEIFAPEEDPLTVALEAMWASDVFVVVPAGNSGPGPGTITSPGIDPVLMTVGAVDDRGTPSVGDDSVPEWTAQGPTIFGHQKPDLAAPGRSLVSLRAPGSTVDLEHASARVEDAYFKGTGTSMSAAVTAGAAALMLQANPRMTPLELKRRLKATAVNPAGHEGDRVGAGLLTLPRDWDNGEADDDQKGPRWRPGAPPVNPPGLDATPEWIGNKKVGWRWIARAWDAVDWAARAWDARAWDSHELAARAWDAARWDARAWDARAWDGRTWDGRTWDGRTWDGRTWDGRTWDGRTWDGRTWDGRTWDGRTWDGRAWDGRAWDSAGWG